MYKQYLNDYEKRADQIRKAARAIEAGENTLAVNTTASKKNMFISKRSNDPISDIIKKLDTDDVLLLALIFVLMSNEEKDMTLIIILGFLFLTGF